MVNEKWIQSKVESAKLVPPKKEIICRSSSKLTFSQQSNASPIESKFERNLAKANEKANFFGFGSQQVKMFNPFKKDGASVSSPKAKSDAEKISPLEVEEFISNAFNQRLEKVC
jgi:hypothetical protein